MKKCSFLRFMQRMAVIVAEDERLGCLCLCRSTDEEFDHTIANKEGARVGRSGHGESVLVWNCLDPLEDVCM